MRIPLFIIVAFFAQIASAQANYKKSAEVPPLRISFSDLQRIVDKASSLAAHADPGVKPWREKVVMGAGRTEVTSQGSLLTPPTATVPKQIDTFTYTYLGADSAAVTRISLDFADYRRTLTVEGSSPEQVDAIFAVLFDDLTAISTPVGGSGVKVLLGSFAYLILLTIVLVSGLYWFFDRKPWALVILLLAAVCFIILIFLPMGELLAGFLAIRGDPSILVRYGPLISFVSLVIALLAIPKIVTSWVGKPQEQRITPATAPESGCAVATGGGATNEALRQDDEGS